MEYKDEWWHSTTMIFVLGIFSFLIIPGIFALVFLNIQKRKRAAFQAILNENNFYSMSIEEKEQKLSDITLKIEENEFIMQEQDVFLYNLEQKFERSVEDEKEAILNEAKEQAAKVIEEAKELEAQIRTEANEESEKIIALAKEEVNEVTTAANDTSERTITDAKKQARQTIEDADEKAEETITSAENEAAEIKKCAEEEAEQSIVETKEKTEQKLKDADELVAELVAKAEEEAAEQSKVTSEKAKETTTNAREEAGQILKEADEEAEAKEKKAKEELVSIAEEIKACKNELIDLQEASTDISKEISKYTKQARKYKSSITGLINFNERFAHTINFKEVGNHIDALNQELVAGGLLDSLIQLNLEAESAKEVGRLVRFTKGEIKNVLKKYGDRYSVKDNRPILHLTAVGLQAEMQMLLHRINNEKVEDAVLEVNQIVTKYLVVCGDGNQTILPTLTQFLVEIEPLYIELVRLASKYNEIKEHESMTV